MRRAKMRWLGITGLVAGLCVEEARPAAAQSGYLQPGDVAVTCVDTTIQAGRSHIQITPLVPLPAATDPYHLQYTDLEADVNGVFYDFDESQKDISPGAKRAGESTLVEVFELSTPDEQVFLFQGLLDDTADAVSPHLVWGFQMSTAGGWAATRMGEVSELPRSLEGANVGVKFNGATRFAYTGRTTGTRAELQAAISDSRNWTADAECPAEFIVEDGGSNGDAGDAGTDVDHADGAGADTDAPASESGMAGASGSGGAGTGGRDGAGGITGTGGVTGAGGGAGTDGGDHTAADGGDTGVGGAGGVILVADAGIGGRSDDGGSAGIGGAPGAGGADGGVDAYDAGATDVDADFVRDTTDTSQARRMPVDSSGCSCSTNGTRSATWIGVAWCGLSLGLLARRRRRQVIPSKDTRSGRAAGRVV